MPGAVMTGRDELVAQARAFMVLLDELRAGKLTADTSRVLLATASANLHELLTITDCETAEGIGCHICGDPATSREGDDLYCAGCGYPVCPGHDAGVAGVVCDRCKAKLDAGEPTRFPVGDAGLAPAEALPMVAMDGQMCGWANPGNLDEVCSARDFHPEQQHAKHGAGGRVVSFWPAIACACCNDFIEAGEYCAQCQSYGCTAVRPRIAAEFPPATPALPWQCYSCGTATGIRCWSGFTHDTDRPACEDHSSLIPGLGTDRECAGCARHRADEAAVPASLALVQGLADGGGE